MKPSTRARTPRHSTLFSIIMIFIWTNADHYILCRNVTWVTGNIFSKRTAKYGEVDSDECEAN